MWKHFRDHNVLRVALQRGVVHGSISLGRVRRWANSSRQKTRQWLIQSTSGASRFGRAPLGRLEISFSQGAEWKALISKYIGTIPLSGDASCAAEQSMSAGPPPRTPVSSAMIAKVGAAARHSQSAAPSAAALPLPAPAPAVSRWVAVIVTELLAKSLIASRTRRGGATRGPSRCA